MTYVVTENCIKCKYMDCVEVCPVDCFHQGPNFLVIDPDECIDCTLCEPECPINAIYPDDDVPAGQEDFVALNADRQTRGKDCSDSPSSSCARVTRAFAMSWARFRNEPAPPDSVLAGCCTRSDSHDLVGADYSLRAAENLSRDSG